MSNSRIYGFTVTFNWILISESEMLEDMHKESNRKYLRFKVLYDNFDESFECTAKCVNIRTLDLLYCKSYNGITLSFRDDDLYDYYRVYVFDGDDKILVAETEDFQVSFDNFTGSEKFGVEAYVKSIGGGYLLRGLAEGTPCEIAGFEKAILSIVIPVYNSMYYIERMLDSILFSDFRKINVICIDDGSTDDTGKILDWYAANYDCVTVVHQENKNRSITRNIGMSLVKTDYMIYADADDLVHPYMYGKMYKHIIDNNEDICIGSAPWHESLGMIIQHMPEEDIFYSREDWVRSCCKQFIPDYDYEFGNRLYWTPSVWKYMARTDMFRRVSFPDETYPNQLLPYEDKAYSLAFLSYADKIGYCSTAYYMYELRQRAFKRTGAICEPDRQFDGHSPWDIFFGAFDYNIAFCNKTRKIDVELIIALDLIRLIRKAKYESVRDLYKEYFKAHYFLSNPRIQADSKLYAEVLKFIV